MVFRISHYTTTWGWWIKSYITSYYTVLMGRGRKGCITSLSYSVSIWIYSDNMNYWFVYLFACLFVSSFICLQRFVYCLLSVPECCMKTTSSLVLNLLNTIPSHIQTYIHIEALTITINSVISNIIVYNKSLISTEFREVFALTYSKCMHNWTISISISLTKVMNLLNKKRGKD